MGDNTPSNITFLGRDDDQSQPPWQPDEDGDWHGRIGERTKTGFKNRDSVCYRNSVLQMLAHSINLLHWIEWYRFKHVVPHQECTAGKNHGRCKACLLYDVILTFWVQGAGDCEITVSAFWDNFFPDWNAGLMKGEQDAAEFWSELYRQLAEDIRTIYLPDLQNVCRLTTVAVIQCRGPNACPTKTYRPEEAEFLSARFPSDEGAAGPISLREAIDQFFTESVIEGSVCDQCHNPRTMSEKLVHLPDYLLVKVNRIEHVQGPNGPRIKKLTRDVALENRLTFSADRFDPRSNEGQGDLEYELTAMVLHAGPTITTGHFYAIVKARGANWMLASDETLTPFPGWSNVAESAQAKKDVYIFAYRRVPKKMPFMEKPATPAKPPTTPLREFPELLNRKPGVAWATKKSVIEGYRAELETIQEYSASLEESFQEIINEGQAHPDDVQEAIEGFRSLKSTLQNIPDIPDVPEDPDALVDEYQRLKDDILDQLGTEPQDEAEERQKLTEDVINNVKEQLDRLAEGSEREERSWSPSHKRARDDTGDVSEQQPRRKRRLRHRLQAKMRGLVNILFTPNGSDEPILHASMQGMLRDVLSDKEASKDSKASKDKSKGKGTGPKTGSTTPVAESSRVTRNQGKRKAAEETENSQAPKRSRTGP